MCLNPIQIFNQSKYINLHHGDPFRLVVPCNHCAECRQINASEWHFRMHYEFKDCIENGGYVLFETLTYSDQYLPHLSDFVDCDYNFPCFNRNDVRYFLVRLRRQLEYKNLGKIRYFLVGELGDKKGRVHYHILIFAPKSIDPIELCKLIKKCWKFGITDYSAPYHGANYMLNNRVFNDYSLHGMRLANYVQKYVQKDSKYDSLLSKVIYSNLHSKFGETLDLTDLNVKSYKVKLSNLLSQFHLQSKGFGLSYLNDDSFSLGDLYDTGMVKFVVPDNLNLYKHIPLPMYYFRKLFMELIEVDGKRLWQLTLDGVHYRSYSEIRRYNNMIRRLKMFTDNLPSLDVPKDLSKLYISEVNKVHYEDLATYILFLRGRYISRVDYAPLSVKLEAVDFYYYGSPNDRFVYGEKFVSKKWLGNDVVGYDEKPAVNYSPVQFADSYTYIDSHLEYVYQMFLLIHRYLAASKQRLFDYKQHLEKLYKYMR